MTGANWRRPYGPKSNINALDIVSRAVGKSGAHKALAVTLRRRLDEAKRLGLGGRRSSKDNQREGYEDAHHSAILSAIGVAKANASAFAEAYARGATR